MDSDAIYQRYALGSYVGLSNYTGWQIQKVAEQSLERIETVPVGDQQRASVADCCM